MAKPTPLGGLVIRYDYLWAAEEKSGREEGAKERPCVVLSAMAADKAEPLRAIICGISHSEPYDEKDAIELPHGVRGHLGLDTDAAERSWVFTSEVNIVEWDDPGIVPLPSGDWSYGSIPRALAEQIREKVLERSRSSRLAVVDRPKIEKKRVARKKREE